MSIKYIVNITRLDLPSVSASLTLYTTSHLLLPASCPLNKQHVHGKPGLFLFLFSPLLCFNTNKQSPSNPRNPGAEGKRRPVAF